MAAALIVVMIWSLFLLCSSLIFGGYIGWLYDSNLYSFTIPYVACALGCLLLCAHELRQEHYRRQRVRNAVILHGLLIIPAIMAMALWPGGDDGPGMGWLFFVLYGSIVATVIALVIGLVAAIAHFRSLRRS